LKRLLTSASAKAYPSIIRSSFRIMRQETFYKSRLAALSDNYRYGISQRSYSVYHRILWMVSIICLFHENDAFSHNSLTGATSLWKNYVAHVHVNRSSRLVVGAVVDTRIQLRSVLCAYRDKRWEGDDIRWISKFRRFMNRSVDWKGQPLRNTIVTMNVVVFAYQTLNTISWIRQRFPQVWPAQFLPIVLDTLMGSSRPGPFTIDFVHSKLLSQRQPHRYLTAGFLHGSIIHLLLNMNAIRYLPSWLETGLGMPLYGTTFLLSVVGGNVLHSLTTTENMALCLGSSGGICGLYGLMYVCLVRMGNHKAAWRVVQGMGFLFLWGLFMIHVSNAGHVGGFLTGIAVALISGPQYRSSYALRRKNTLEVDIYSRDYRLAMGYDKVPSESGWLSLPLLWSMIALSCLSQANLRSMPLLIIQGLKKPGSLSGFVI
jgi:membrane associated rhomboid family serine protease